MDNNTSPSLTDVIQSDIGSSTYSTSSSSGTFSGWLSSISWSTWFIVVLILAFLGFNIFVYLAQGTQSVADFFAPITQSVLGTLGYGISETTQQVVEVSGEGTKKAIDIGATGAKDVVTATQKAAEMLPSRDKKSAPLNAGMNTRFTEDDYVDKNSLSKNLDMEAPQKRRQGEYEADDSYSSVQGKSKAGWCFIGESNGRRTCASVSESDTCMSGNIFPSYEICVNPNLRR